MGELLLRMKRQPDAEEEFKASASGCFAFPGQDNKIKRCPEPFGSEHPFVFI